MLKCVATTVQFGSFGIIAEADLSEFCPTSCRNAKLFHSEVTTREARVTMLTHMFRQEIGYHDDPAPWHDCDGLRPLIYSPHVTLWRYDFQHDRTLHISNH